MPDGCSSSSDTPIHSKTLNRTATTEGMASSQAHSSAMTQSDDSPQQPSTTIRQHPSSLFNDPPQTPNPQRSTPRDESKDHDIPSTPQTTARGTRGVYDSPDTNAPDSIASSDVEGRDDDSMFEEETSQREPQTPEDSRASVRQYEDELHRLHPVPCRPYEEVNGEIIGSIFAPKEVRAILAASKCFDPEQIHCWRYYVVVPFGTNYLSYIPVYVAKYGFTINAIYNDGQLFPAQNISPSELQKINWNNGFRAKKLLSCSRFVLLPR